MPLLADGGCTEAVAVRFRVRLRVFTPLAVALAWAPLESVAQATAAGLASATAFLAAVLPVKERPSQPSALAPITRQPEQLPRLSPHP